MKYIIISDIHSNYESLSSFNDFIQPMLSPGDVFLCLGDIVGYGPQPSECISFVRDKCAAVISGDHERMLLDKKQRESANDRAQRAIEWTDEVLEPEEKEYLASLPEKIEMENDFFLAHGSPADPDAYILRHSQAEEAIAALRDTGSHICFFGHTHLPGIFDEDGNYFYQENVSISLLPDRYYLINPGSTGQPRDRDPRGSFCTIDDELRLIFYRYDYDQGKVFEDIKSKGLPPDLGERLLYGI